MSITNKIAIKENSDGSRDIVHPSGVVVHQSCEYAARMKKKKSVDDLIARSKRQILIDNWPNCGHHCPKGREFDCGCELCAENNGYFQPGEIEQFGQEDQEIIRSCWRPETGYWGKDGCRLPVRLRPIRCLEYVCTDKE